MYYDSITGLPVPESFIEFAMKMRESAADNRFAILSLNIGSFHKINQLYGYREGNALLAALAQRLIRSHDYMLSACRIEADSFIILLDNELLSPSHMEAQLQQDFNEFTKYESEQYPNVNLPLWGGICLLTREFFSIEKAIECAITARTALESSATSAHKSLAFYHNTMGTLQQENKILPLFEDIMNNKHLIIYLQPKFHLDSSPPVGAEALVRIMDTKGRLLKPISFLPVLEKYNLAHELDLMVIETILKLLRRWRKQGLDPIPISVNLASADFTSEEFLKIFADIAEKYKTVLQYLEFEFEAAAYYSNAAYMEQMVHNLHDMGCLVSLDSFGSDNLPVSALEIPPVDRVKFNRNFLRTGMKNPKNLYVLMKIAEMFEACDIPVVCEGIENAQENLFVQECGIQYVQGFYYGRPVPFDIFQKKYMMFQPAHFILL